MVRGCAADWPTSTALPLDAVRIGHIDGDLFDPAAPGCAAAGSAPTARSWSGPTVSSRGAASARGMTSRSSPPACPRSSLARSLQRRRRGGWSADVAAVSDGALGAEERRRRDRRLRPGRPGARRLARDAPGTASPSSSASRRSTGCRGPSTSTTRSCACCRTRRGRELRRRDGALRRVPLVRRRRRPADDARPARPLGLGLGTGLPVLPARAGGGARRAVAPSRRA